MHNVNSRFKYLIVITLLIASGLARADAAQDINDARLESQIWTTYALSPYLRANDLKVTVHDGKATLTGTVDEDINKELAKQIAVGVKGIKEVDNRIVVQSNYSPKSTYGYGETIDDVTITATVKSRLIWSKYSYVSTTVETKSGHVSLTGTVNSQAAKDLAERLAANTRGVATVKNLIVIDDRATPTNNAKATANEASKNIADAWITAKIKSNFFYSTNVSGSNIDVTTNAGAVTLKGKVNSGTERALAIEIAENVRGVKSVNTQGLTF